MSSVGHRELPEPPPLAGSTGSRLPHLWERQGWLYSTTVAIMASAAKFASVHSMHVVA